MKTSTVFNDVEYFPSLQMTTLKNRKKLEAINRDNHEKHPTNNHTRDINVPRNQEDYIAHVSKKIEGRVSRKSSQDFSRTKSRTLNALSKLDGFLLKPEGRIYSVPFHTHPGNQINRARKQMKIVPRLILILNWVFL